MEDLGKPKTPSTTITGSRGSKNSRLFDTLHCGNMYSVNGCTLQSFNRPSAKVGFTTKANGRVKLLFGESGLLPNSSGKTFACNALISDLSGGIEVQPNSVDFGILAADMVLTTSGFAVEDDEFDLDQLSEGFSSITEAIEDIRQGNVVYLMDIISFMNAKIFSHCVLNFLLCFWTTLQMVVVVDDEDRENEGDIIMAASKVTPEAMAFFVKHGTGIVCVSMKEEDLERFQLPQMVSHKENEEKLRTAFTMSVGSFGHE